MKPTSPILETRIPCGRSLIGQRGFFFDPPNDGAAGGGAPNQGGGANPNPGGSGDFPSGGGQQQQQQNGEAAPDPFQHVDLNLLDEATRNAVTQARTTLNQLHGQARVASQHQSRADQLQNQIRLYEERLQSMQNPANNRGNGNGGEPPEPTLEDELFEMLQQANPQMPEAQARNVAKYQAGMLGKFGNHFEKKIGQRFAPVAALTLNHQVQGAFEEIQQRDNFGALAIPEVAQAVWENMTQLAERGQAVTPEVANNLVSIYYMNHLRANGGAPNMNQISPPANNPAPFPNNNGNGNGNGNLNTRFTYPGAGIHARPPQNQQQNGNTMSSEEAAALAATTASWPVQPKNQLGKPARTGVFVTRNGQ